MTYQQYITLIFTISHSREFDGQSQHHRIRTLCSSLAQLLSNINAY